ncbi:MAG: methyltransferase domain-containing protein [Ktedonobacteraceae bacterium]
MNVAIDTHPYRERFVERLEANGDITSKRVREAFLAVPRHLFFKYYYRRQQNGWEYCPREETDSWYETIYSDEGLISLLDDDGHILSCGSQPAVMAWMLEALDVRPGQRVLEIGTGTGYNAALLAYLTGDPRLVTTIDIEAQTIAAAASAIGQAVGPGMTVVVGDGREGYAANAPYDRIIVTGGYPTVPLAWKEQLAQNGILACVIEPGLMSGAVTGGVLRAVKEGSRLSGHVVRRATFMLLHAGGIAQQSRRYPRLENMLLTIPARSSESPLFDPSALSSPDFMFLLYYDLPDFYWYVRREGSGMAKVYALRSHPEAALVIAPDGEQMELRGDERQARIFWNHLLRAYSFWLHLGRPGITDYKFEMPGEEGFLSITMPTGTVWPFAP